MDVKDYDMSVEIPQDIVDQWDTDDRRLIEIEIDGHLSAIENAFYLTQDDRYERYRVFGPVIEHLYKTMSTAWMQRQIDKEFRELLQKVSVDDDGVMTIGREIYRTYEENRNLKNGSMREESFGIINYHRFIAEHLLSFPENVQRVNEFLEEIIKKNSASGEESDKGRLMLLLAEDGLFGEDAMETINKIVHMIPEATLSTYHDEYEAALHFYPMWKSMKE